MNLAKDINIGKIESLLKNDACASAIKVEGTWGSFAPCLAAHLSRTIDRPILYVTSNIDEADNAADDIGLFVGKPIQTLPAWEAEPDLSDATNEIGAQRLRIAMSMARFKKDKAKHNFMLSASVQALCQPIPTESKIQNESLRLKVNQTIEPELVMSWLTDQEFENVDRIDMPGQYAHRGGIIDIFPPVAYEDKTKNLFDKPINQTTMAVRIEFFGDEIESIRIIDLDTQVSSKEIKNINILATKRDSSSSTDLFLNLLPANTAIIMEEPTNIQEFAEIFLNRLDDPRGMYSWDAVHDEMQKFTRLEISRFPQLDDVNTFNLSIKSIQQFEHKAGPMWVSNKTALQNLLEESQKGKKVFFYCENDAETKRVKEIIAESNLTQSKNFKIKTGFLNRGFFIESLNTIVAPHHEIFGQYTLRRKTRSIRPTAPIDNFVDLKTGDYVVHVNYGIGKFKGISTIAKKDIASEYLTLEYADQEMIHVPVANIALVHKYIGSGPSKPPLSKLGTKKWENQKLKVAQSIQDLAAELLQIQAQREQLGGIQFDMDDDWQKQFEDCFPYQETVDQLTAIEQIKKDMQSNMPMDRLLCGDVGFGKTELAMRAAFKAVKSGKQVAVLVPTTVLCVQHGRSFQERFADFPITIETLNRFKTAKQAKDITEKAQKGQIDILIGTHRLLSDDVRFKDLGLLIIDEEQRFGVEHKEKLKKIRVNIDVLTMTATPIPRTLHMSLLGLRDISSLTTPPLDRRSVTTLVNRYSNETIKKSILRELNRQGQVFFLHNRVKTIEKMADTLKALVPDSKIDIAHGQMPVRKLENAMVKFVVGKTDVLVCSTIIESGLDIPNANTIIINNADRFGLAQLHQLRGRVGRYKHRAFAYLLMPPDRPVSPVAAKRLKAIEEYSHLGAGFKIALRDLEIRGAGNILGPEQSGHINLIGYEMYCKLLTDSVKKLKHEPVVATHETVVNLGFSSYIPKNYIPSDRQRMEVYRKIAVASNAIDLRNLEKEIRDLFGPIPQEVELLLDMTDIRIKATAWKIQSIITSGLDLIFAFPKGNQQIVNAASNLFAKAPGNVRIPDPYTVHLRLSKNYFEPPTLLAILRKIFRQKPPKSL